MGWKAGKVVIDEDFSRGMDNWWSEGCERVWVEDGRLYIQAEGQDNEGGSGTVWCRTPHPANFMLEYDAHVVSSSQQVNNINIFFCFNGPGGTDLFATRGERETGRYRLYHELPGYIVTFLRDEVGEGGRHPDGSAKGRHRMRREPGFQLVQELFDKHCEAGNTYHLRVTKKGGQLTFEVDGEKRLEWTDANPWGEGHIGLRTFRTLLWWNNIRLTELIEE